MKEQTEVRGNKNDVRSLVAIILVLLIHLSVLISLPTIGDVSSISLDCRQKIAAANPVTLDLTYYSSSNLTEVPVVPDSTIAGDHIILRALWSTSDVNRSRLQVFAPAIPTSISIEKNTNLLELDTRNLGNNATCLINSTAWLINGTVISKIIQNVYIGNFFVPRIRVITPNGGEQWTGVNTITWLASDSNYDESLSYDVRISSDSGITFVTLASSLTQKYYNWNCSSYEKLDTYIVEIRVTDGIYFSSDRSNSPFTAGDIISNWTSTTTTTTTTPQNNTSQIDARLAIIIAILVLSSAVMALLVYYVARKWF